MKNYLGLNHRLYDYLVFDQIKAMLGGNIRLMTTSAGPLAGEVIDLLQICFGCMFIKGYIT